MAMESQAHIFLRILVPFCAGIGVLHYTHFTKLNLLLPIFVIFTVFLLFIFNYLYRSLEVYHHKKKLALLLYLSFFLLGAVCLWSSPDALDDDHFSVGKAKYLKIYVADEPRETTGLLRFKARVIAGGNTKKMGSSGGLLMISLPAGGGHFQKVSYGQVYLIPARFNLIPAPGNPAEFDSKTWMANQHIYHQAFLSSEELIFLPQQRGSTLIRFALKLRKQQVELYRSLIKSDEAFAVAATLILGYRAELDAETMAAYAKTGTIHALSVSGMHVAMVYLILEYALGWMNRKAALKWLKLIVILALVWFYTLITGCSASVLRSAIMLSMLILTKSLHKNTGGYHILALSAFFLLFYDPCLLWDAGFQLSYLAVFGLIYLHPRIYALLSFSCWPLRQAWGIISVSLAAQLFTWPLSLYYFHQFPVYFLVSNLFIALPVAILMYAGLAILLFRLYWLAGPFEWLLTFMNHGLEQIASLPCSTIHAVWISKTELALLFMGMLCVVTGICERRKYDLMAGVFLMILFQGMMLSDKAEARRQMTIILYSLNRNYAAAFIRSDKALLITDLSAADRVFKFHIQPALDQRKIKYITCLPWHMIYRQGGNQMKLEGLAIDDHQLRFRNFRVLLADSFLNHKRIIGMPAFDAIWIHGNPSIQVAELRKSIRFKKIWLDATNRNGLISEIEKDTLKFKSSILVFKQIKASLVNLK